MVLVKNQPGRHTSTTTLSYGARLLSRIAPPQYVVILENAKFVSGLNKGPDVSVRRVVKKKVRRR